jgi:hypothetical protein
MLSASEARQTIISSREAFVVTVEESENGNGMMVE